MQRRLVSYIVLTAMLLTFVTGIGPALAQPAAVYINEIQVSTTGTDWEFFELQGASGTDLSGLALIGIESDAGTSAGTIDLVIDLGGQLIPADGFWLGINETGAGTYGVTGDLSIAENSFENSTATYFLVSGFAGAQGADLDGDDDGTLDSTPWDAVLDSVNIRDSASDFDYGAPSVGPDGTFLPSGTFRCPDAPAGTFDANMLNFSTPDGTPGIANNCPLPPLPAVYINEIQVSTTGTDWEFFELQGAPGTDLGGLALIGIESDAGTSAGTIDLVIDLGGQLIPADGFWLGINETGAGTYGLTGDLSIAENSFENSTATYFLVSGFAGAQGADLDGDDDGTLDSTPWDAVLDSVNIRDSAGDFDYGAPSVGPDGTFLPSGTFRCPDAPAGTFDANMLNFSTPDGTPGAANNCAVPVPELVINEIDYDQPGTDAAEFIEIKNIGSSAVDLSTVALELVNGTGGGASVYKTISLPSVSLAAGDYFVVCASSTTVANCDLDVDPDSNLIQNGAPDAVALAQGTTIIDAVSYEGDTGAPYTEGSGAGLEDSGDMGVSRCPDGTDTNQNNVDFSLQTISPGVANVCEEPPPPEACGDEYTPIYTIQGSGMASALDGSEVATEGIVVGDFQVGGKNGFFIQDAAGDGDAATSDGVFVFSTSLDVNVGDHVRVRGYVDEYYGLTEITGVSQVWLCSEGSSVAPTALSLPVTSLDDFEPYEGMLVTFPQALYITEYFNFDRYGEIVLTSVRRNQPTAVYEPGSPEQAALVQANLLDRITLDDGRTAQNPDPAIHPNGNVFDLGNLFRGGDTVSNVTGVIDYSFDLYRIQPTQGTDYVAANPRTAQPDDVGGNLKVASFNVLNYFTTIDTGAFICGPAEDQECRGADTLEELNRQRAKIIAALAAINADVVGLIEIENHPGDLPTADLVSGLNDELGPGTYDYIATSAIGTDAIRQAFIYKPASVSPVGAYAILDSSVDPRFLDDYNRPVLAQTFQDNATGGIFTVAVNHLKSKGSDCNAIGDPDLGDGAGNCNLTRKAAAEALVDWLASDPTSSGDGDFLIIGDLNSYDKEDPIDALLAGGYTDLVYHFQGEYAYSYVFDGQLGYLDHALANADLLAEITGTTVWHINADEPDLIDYDMSFKKDAQDALYAPDAYRSSDHDPVIVGLNVCDEIAPAAEVWLTPDTLWPVNHKYVEVVATVDATDNFDPNPIVTLVLVTSSDPEDGLGDGQTTADIEIIDDFTFNLRAERSGKGQDRVYTITYEVTDACGNSTLASATVTVPHDRSKGDN